MRHTLLIIALLFLTTTGFTQVADYSFTAVSGSFTPLSGATDLDAIEADDILSSAINIGFTFNYDGVDYTQVKVSSNGWVTFNTAASSSTTSNNLDLSSTTIRPLLAPLWDDLDGRAASGSTASYLVTGSSPNRIFTIECLDWEWNYGAGDNVISFQVKLYETTNVIEFVYQQEADAVNSGTASIGITGSGTGSGTFLSLDGTGASPLASSTTETATLSTKPATGQIYRFSPPSCLSPSSLAAGSISSSSADLSWTDNAGASQWDIELGANGFAPTGTPTQSSVSNPYTYSGLSGATSYDYYVRADCGGSGYSNWVGPFNFTTACAAYTPVYLQDFTSFIPTCWDEADAGTPAAGPSTMGTGSWVADGLANVGTTGAAKINLYSNTKEDWLISPYIDLTVGGPFQLEFDFAIMQYGSSTVSGTLGSDDEVHILITDDNGATWTALQVWNSSSSVAVGGEHFIYDLTAYSGSTVQFAFWATEGSTDDSNDNDISVDNFLVDIIPACSAPTVLAAGSITETTADLSWTDNAGASQWDIELGANGFAPTGTPTQSSVTNPYTYTGLTGSTSYDYYVRADCGGSGYSGWSGPFNFTTSAAICPTTISALPYTEGFESGLGDWVQSSTDDIDWTSQTGSTPSLSTGPTAAHGGSNYFFTEASSQLSKTAILNSPCFDFASCAAPEISFWYHMYGADMGSLDLEVEATPGSGTWVSVWSLSGNQTDNWYQATVDLSAYGSTTVKLRFRAVTGTDYTSDMAIDDIQVQCMTDMLYSSSTVTQNNTSNIVVGTTNGEVIGVEIVTTGSLNAIDVSSFTFNVTGSDNPATNITNATLWTTGNTGTFATTTQVGDVEIGPTGSFTVGAAEAGMPYTLSTGTNYFWLTYTIPLGANLGEFVDAQCTSITVDASNYSPTNNPPAGNRMIADCMLGTSGEDITLPFSDMTASTCGESDDVTSSNVTNVCGSIFYYEGEDYTYIFTPSSSGNIIIDLSSAGSYTGLALYEGCPTGSGTCVSQQQSSSGNESMCVAVTNGTKYYLVIDSDPSPSCNDFEISISAPNGSNTGFTCATAHNIGVLPFSVNNMHTACSGDDYTSATSGVCSTTYATGEDYVFEYTASSAECISITLSNTNAYAAFAVYDDCPGTGSCLVSGHDATGTVTQTVTLPSAGTYYIVIDSDNTSAFNTPFDLSITSFGAGQANDLPCNAEPLGIGSILSGNNECSSGADTPGNPSCGVTGTFNSVWYSVVVPASGEIKIKTELLSLSNTVLSLWSGTCDNLTEIDCNDDMEKCGWNQYLMSEIHATGLTPGETLFVCVDGYSDLVGTFTIMAIDGIDTYIPSFGQDCGLSQAIPVCNSQFTVGNPGYQAVGNICDFAESQNCMSGGERGSVWYSIPIAADGNLEFTLVPNDYDPLGSAGNETDYDFGLWKFVGTGAVDCDDIAAGDDGVVCNFSIYGITGLYDIGDAPAGYDFAYNAAFEPALPVLAGEVYVLVISNFSNSTSGFNIDFGVGSPILYPGTPTTLTWTGGAGNTDWYTPMNWGNCNAYPDETIDVIIPPSSMFQPIIDRIDPNDGTNARCKSITINPGASLTNDAGFVLEVYGDYNNTGTLSANTTSTTKFMGAANQNMDGNMTGFSKFGYFVIDKTGGDVTLNNNLEIESDFTTANATSILNSNGMYVTVAGYFTLNASTTYTGAGTTGILEFNGTSPQVFSTGTGGTLQLNHVIMNHTSTGLTINDDLSVGTSGILTMTDGIIHTGANKVIVNNTASSGTTIGSATSYVNGNFRGYITNNTETYLYPVGVSNRYTLAKIFNNNMTGTNYFDVKFLDSFTNTGILNPAIAIDFGTPYIDIAMEGIWDITPNLQPTGGTYSLELYFDDGQGYDGGGMPLGNGFTSLSDNMFGIVKRSSASTVATAWTSQDGTLNANGGLGRMVSDNYARRNDLSSFSSFALARTDFPLAVEMADINARCNDENIVLAWETITETNNDYFTILKRVEEEFIAIATIDGSGNSNDALKYSYIDKNLTGDVAYYRVKQTDFDGKTKYSQIIKSDCDGFADNRLRLYPNPTKDYVYIDYYGDVEVEIRSVDSRKLINSNEKRIDISHLPSSVYIITIKDENGQILKTERITKI